MPLYPPASTGSAITVKESDGSPSVTPVTEIKVSNGTLTDNTGGSVTIATGASGSGTLTTIKDEGSDLDTAVTSIDFVGAGVTATNVSHAVTVTIPSGGGLTQSYLGYNTIGASTEAITANRIFMKKFTMASAGLVNELELYLDEDADQVCGLPVIAIWADNAGVPDSLVAQQGDETAADNFYLGASSSSWPARWIGVGSFGKWLTAADYWVGWMFGDVGAMRMYYDAGADRYMSSGAAWLANGARYSQTDSTRKYSARVTIIR